jgi:hypothetical protein
MIPEWMNEVDLGPCKRTAAPPRSKKRFVQKTLDGIFAFLPAPFNEEGFSQRDGLL